MTDHVIVSARGPKRMTCIHEPGTYTVQIESDEPFELKVSVRQVVRRVTPADDV